MTVAYHWIGKKREERATRLARLGSVFRTSIIDRTRRETYILSIDEKKEEMRGSVIEHKIQINIVSYISRLLITTARFYVSRE